MPKLINTVPKYRKHRAYGQAVVSTGGRDFYLGPYCSRASRIEYDPIITDWLANGGQPTIGPHEAPSLTVAEVVVQRWAFAKGHYRRGARRLPRSSRSSRR